MITLTAKINLLLGENSALSLGSDDLSGNNISSNLSGIVGSKKNGSNPFIIGASKLGDGSTFSNKVDYFIGNKSSDENGDFEKEYMIGIKSTNPLNTITIAFDTLNNRHPKKIRGVFYKNIETKYGRIDKYGVYIDYDVFTTVPKNLTEKDIIISGIYNLSKQKEEHYKIYNFKIENGNLSFSVELDMYGVPKEDVDKYLYENPFLYVYFEYTQYYEDDDAIFTIINLEDETEFSIIIDNWNTPNYPLVITGIYTIIDINIDYRNLISISRSIFDRSDLKLPSFGIISNTGNIEFNDTDGEILDYAEQLLLEKGLKCEIKLNNTLVEGANKSIGLFETDQWNYDNDSRVVSVSLKDDLQEWQDIDVKGIDYDPRKAESKPFSGLYAYLWELTSNRYYATRGIKGKGNYNMLAPDELDIDTQKVLENTYIEYPFLENGTMWQQWTKLCQACQLHIYKNNEGIIVCRYNGGN